eukprot:7700349-Ditylum_brightwellii.AAC.1
MYSLKPHGHDTWLECVKKNQEYKKKREEKATSPSPITHYTPCVANGNSSSISKLTLNENLKAILCTNCAMSEEQIQDMVDTYNE